MSKSPAGYKVDRANNRKGPHLITCLATDGDQSRWREVGPVIDGTGATCYWKADDPETKTLENKWKKSAGQSLARLLNLTDDTTDEDWRLTNLPSNYKLYRYIKGNREDNYLLGSEFVLKFRTANELSPHLHWLCTHEPTKENRYLCRCKYCSGSKSQQAVNSSLGFPETASPSLSGRATSHNKRKAEVDMVKETSRRRTTSEVTTQRTTRTTTAKTGSRKSLPANGANSVTNGTSFKKNVFNGPYVNKDRDRDLVELQCAFRMAELVWCKLDQPIRGAEEDYPDAQIQYWPAICEERVLLTDPTVVTHASKKFPTEKSPNGSASSSTRPESHTKVIPNTEPTSDGIYFNVTQRYHWKVRLLGTRDIFWKPETELLAYLNYPTPLNLCKIPITPSTLQHINDGHESDRPSLKNLQTISEAITTFALSLQMSVHIKNYWSLMDRYDIPYLKRIERSTLPPQELQTLYEDAALPWFQYLWWGAEKIWSGDLVRLIVSAKDLPKGLRALSPGSANRCFFLQITGIYRSEQEKGMVKGPIFELAHEQQRELDKLDRNPDFDESLSPSNSNSALISRYIPQAPPNHYFRRLTALGKEHHLVLQHIAGRYYPPHQLSMPPDCDMVNGIDKLDPQSGNPKIRSLSLCGLTAGRWLHMHCTNWIADRKECFKTAETLAEQDFLQWKPPAKPPVQPNDIVVPSSNPPNVDNLPNSSAVTSSTPAVSASEPQPSIILAPPTCSASNDIPIRSRSDPLDIPNQPQPQAIINSIPHVDPGLSGPFTGTQDLLSDPTISNAHPSAPTLPHSSTSLNPDHSIPHLDFTLNLRPSDFLPSTSASTSTTAALQPHSDELDPGEAERLMQEMINFGPT